MPTILDLYAGSKYSKTLPTDKNKDKTPIDDDKLKESILETSRKGKKNFKKYTDTLKRE